MMDTLKPIPSVPDNLLRKIAEDYHNGEIFSNINCDSYMGVFLSLVTMTPQPPDKPVVPEDIDVVNNRDLIADFFIEEENIMNRYNDGVKEYYENLDSYTINFLPSVGFIYEYSTKAIKTPDVGGLPLFFTCNFLNHSDTKKMLEYYFELKS